MRKEDVFCGIVTGIFGILAVGNVKAGSLAVGIVFLLGSWLLLALTAYAMGEENAAPMWADEALVEACEEPLHKTEDQRAETVRHGREGGITMNWISVKEMPKETGFYLVYRGRTYQDEEFEGNVVDVGFFKASPENEFIAAYDRSRLMDKYAFDKGVTHWMPLPEPPQEAKRMIDACAAWEQLLEELEELRYGDGQQLERERR